MNNHNLRRKSEEDTKDEGEGDHEETNTTFFDDIIRKYYNFNKFSLAQKTKVITK